MINTIDINKPVCLDIETTGLDRHRCDITSIQIGYTSTETGEYTRKFFDYKKLGDRRVNLLMNKLKECKLVTHNGKFDLLFLYEKTGISLSLWIDTLVLAHVCGEHPLGLKPLTEKYFHVSYDIEKEAKTGKITEEFKAYGLDDVLYPMKLLEIFREKVTRYGLLKVFKHEMRAYKAYYEIEKTGVPISPRRFEVKAKLEAELKPYAEKLLTYGDINWNSSQQVAKILFGELDLPLFDEEGKRVGTNYNVCVAERMDGGYGNEVLNVITTLPTRKEANAYAKELKKTGELRPILIKSKPIWERVLLGYGQGLRVIEKTKTGNPSVGVDTLANYRGNDCVDTLLEYKRLTKLLTFINSWEELQVDDKIYPSFNITARTGRTTCSNPNLQQCPQDSYVRNLIEARPGYKVLECDFSQAELRVASWFSGDENMQYAYQSGSDLHSKTTELLFGDTSTLGHDEQKRLRTYSKSMNFGFLYGMSAKTFVDYAKGYSLNLSQEESEKLRNDFFTAYPRLLPWHEECKEFARKHGYVVSPIGRKRWFDNIHSNDFKKRAGDERQSINSTVQGFASDMCISALADIVFSEELDHSKFTVLGSVHDAILLEAREDYAEELGKKVQEIMEHPSIAKDLDIPVPMKADLEISQSWGGH